MKTGAFYILVLIGGGASLRAAFKTPTLPSLGSILHYTGLPVFVAHGVIEWSSCHHKVAGLIPVPLTVCMFSVI